MLGRPVDFYYDGATHGVRRGGCSREVLLIGTPLLWWAFVPMLLWLAWHWFTTRDWRAAAVWIAFVAGWLVWFQDLKRTMFLFYMAPLVPFLVIGLTLALGVDARAGGPRRRPACADRARRRAAPVGRRGGRGLPRPGDRRLRLDVADLHRRDADLQRNGTRICGYRRGYESAMMSTDVGGEDET